MRFLFIQIVIVVLITSCHGQSTEQESKTPSGIHKVVIQEVVQTTNYTYLRVQEGDNEKWLAAPKISPKLGETYFFQGGMEMPNFKSKELGREFELVYFISKLGTSEETVKNVQISNNKVPNDDIHSNHNHSTSNGVITGSEVKEAKTDVKVAKVKGGISIAELFAKKKEYAGKKVILKGQVTKFNAAIMNRNWIHLQDGTDHNGSFDITVTSKQECNVGDVITIEGTVVLNRDFGYGYKYDILIEDAVKK